MKTTPELRHPLGTISFALARIHKTLLENEIEDMETKLNVVLSPADRLQVLLNDPSVSWLRSLSQLIASVDEVYFQKEPIQQEQWDSALKRIEDLFSMTSEMTGDSAFSSRYRSMLTKVPDLMPQHSLLRMAMAAKPTETK